MKLYLEARNRAINRATEGPEFMDECRGAFLSGMDIRREEIAPNRFLSESNDGFSRICGLLTVVQAKKGKSYQASWQRRGMEGAFSNLQRKYDRIDALVNTGNEPGESLMSQLADMAVYAIFMMSLQASLKPEELSDWVAEVKSL
jgi:hypothetical protein